MAEPCLKYPKQRASTESADESVSALDGGVVEVSSAGNLEDSDVDDLDADALAGKHLIQKRWDEHKHDEHTPPQPPQAQAPLEWTLCYHWHVLRQ